IPRSSKPFMSTIRTDGAPSGSAVASAIASGSTAPRSRASSYQRVNWISGSPARSSAPRARSSIRVTRGSLADDPDCRPRQPTANRGSLSAAGGGHGDEGRRGDGALAGASGNLAEGVPAGREVDAHPVWVTDRSGLVRGGRLDLAGDREARVTARAA